MSEAVTALELPVCRFCLDDVITINNPFIQPCMCKGSVENVHLRCLLRWIYQRGATHTLNDECSMCKTIYVYTMPQLEESASQYSRVMHYFAATPLVGIWYFGVAAASDYIPMNTQMVFIHTLIASYYGFTTLRQVKNRSKYIYYYFKHWPIHLLALVAIFIIFSRNNSGSVLLIYNYVASIVWHLTTNIDMNIRMRINKYMLKMLTQPM